MIFVAVDPLLPAVGEATFCYVDGSVPASALPPEPVSVGPSPQIGPERPPSCAHARAVIDSEMTKGSNGRMGAS